MLRRDFLTISLCSAAIAMVPVMAQAQSPIMSAPDAQTAVDAGAMILIDIRSPQEWTDTGIAKGAWPVSMHTPGFGPELAAILRKFPDRKVGLICATGGRSGYVTKVLEKNGINGIIDVSEGMLGNPRGPGWIARKLPIVDLATAQTTYQEALR